MNLQAMMQQAQKMQKDMMKAKQEIENKTYSVKKSFVELEINGKKEVLKININKEMSLEKEDIEMLEDMIVLSLNEVFTQIDKEMEEKLSRFGPGLSGLF